MKKKKFNFLFGFPRTGLLKKADNNLFFFVLFKFFFVVFFFFLTSCGIPSICELTEINIIKNTTSDNSISFKVNGTDIDLYLVSNGPGLLLCYVVSDNLTFTETDTIRSEFSKFVNYNKIFINDDSSILEYNYDDNKIVLYAFKLYNENEELNPSSPLYCLNLNSFIDEISINADFSLQYDQNNKIINLSENTIGNINKSYSFTNDKNLQYLHIFASFSAEEGRFSNIYWSSLTYIGSIDLKEGE